MAATPKPLVRQALPSSSATLYTVPAGTTTVVTSIVLTNTHTSAVTATIAFNGIVLIPAISVAINTAVEIGVRQPIAAGQTITGFASVASVLNAHIGGAEWTP